MGARPRPRRRKMAKRISQSLLWLIAAAALARASESRLAAGARQRRLQEIQDDALAPSVVIEDFSGPVDAFFLDDGSAAGLPSSGDSALEKVDQPGNFSLPQVFSVLF